MHKSKNLIQKNILSILILSSIGAYALYRNNLKTTPIATNTQDSNTIATSIPVADKKTTSDTSNTNTSSNIPTPSKSGIYKDGTYTGNVADAYYEDMQVQVVISGGKITEVNMIGNQQYRDRSIAINAHALPILKQEVLVAQSAKINAVSGASYTSPAFIESLSSALDQAKS